MVGISKPESKSMAGISKPENKSMAGLSRSFAREIKRSFASEMWRLRCTGSKREEILANGSCYNDQNMDDTDGSHSR